MSIYINGALKSAIYLGGSKKGYVRTNNVLMLSPPAPPPSGDSVKLYVIDSNNYKGMRTGYSGYTTPNTIDGQRITDLYAAASTVHCNIAGYNGKIEVTINGTKVTVTSNGAGAYSPTIFNYLDNKGGQNVTVILNKLD